MISKEEMNELFEEGIRDYMGYSKDLSLMVKLIDMGFEPTNYCIVRGLAESYHIYREGRIGMFIGNISTDLNRFKDCSGSDIVLEFLQKNQAKVE